MLKEIKNLLLPTKSESVFYVALALLLLIVQNISRYWSYFSGVTFEEVKNASSLGGKLEYWVLNSESKIDPRIADFLVWMLLGMIVISLVLVIQSNFRSANQERDLLEHMRNPSNRTHELEIYTLKIAVRVAAFIALLVYTRVFLGFINDSLTSLFFVSTLNLSDITSWLWLFVSISAFAVSLYVFAVLARIALLRTRIFN